MEFLNGIAEGREDVSRLRWQGGEEAISPVALRRFMALRISPCSCAAIAENFMERDIIRERTMAGLERARAQGKKLGRPLQSGKVYRRPALMDVAKLHSQGQSIREIAKQLETSKYWVEYSINEIHRNPDKLRGVSL